MTVNPNAFAVLRLISSSTLKGAGTGEFARLLAAQVGSALIDAMTLGKSSREV
jgi:hypothetical protein